MNHPRHGSPRALPLVLALSALLGGCQSLGRNDIPPGAMPHPVGHSVNGVADLQRARADEHQFIVHRAAWVGFTDKLGPAGRRQMDRIADASMNPAATLFPVTVEVDAKRPGLNSQRLAVVRGELESRGAVVSFAPAGGSAMDDDQELMADEMGDGDTLSDEEKPISDNPREILVVLGRGVDESLDGETASDIAPRHSASR